jgi:hypothetical protein
LATRAAEQQSRSNGLTPSSFQSWLDGERERGRYLGYMELNAPDERYGLE